MNFGKTPFAFDIESYVNTETQKTLGQILSKKKEVSFGKLTSLIQSHLYLRGFMQTLKSFEAEIQKQKELNEEKNKGKDRSAAIARRARIVERCGIQINEIPGALWKSPFLENFKRSQEKNRPGAFIKYYEDELSNEETKMDDRQGGSQPKVILKGYFESSRKSDENEGELESDSRERSPVFSENEIESPNTTNLREPNPLRDRETIHLQERIRREHLHSFLRHMISSAIGHLIHSPNDQSVPEDMIDLLQSSHFMGHHLSRREVLLETDMDPFDDFLLPPKRIQLDQDDLLTIEEAEMISVIKDKHLIYSEIMEGRVQKAIVLLDRSIHFELEDSRGLFLLDLLRIVEFTQMLRRKHFKEAIEYAQSHFVSIGSEEISLSLSGGNKKFQIQVTQSL